VNFLEGFLAGAGLTAISFAVGGAIGFGFSFGRHYAAKFFGPQYHEINVHHKTDEEAQQ
jgi:hypothetical protein